MKIAEISVTNYRSVADLRIHPRDILALVGRNNSGKSNVLKALQLFFEGSLRLVDEECFHNHDLDKPIRIFLTFDDLSTWEREQFEPWMDGDRLTLGRTVTAKSEEEFSSADSTRKYSGGSEASLLTPVARPLGSWA